MYSTPKNEKQILPKGKLLYKGDWMVVAIFGFTVESLEFKVARFSWYSWVALTHEFTSSTKTNYKRFSFPTKLKTDPSMKLHPLE